MSEEHRSNVDRSNSDEFADDPLAELARIVSGQSDSADDEDLSGRQAEPPATVVKHAIQRGNYRVVDVASDDLEMSLEAELARELEGDVASSDEGQGIAPDHEADAFRSQDATQPETSAPKADFHGDLIKALQDEISVEAGEPSNESTAAAEDAVNGSPTSHQAEDHASDEMPVMLGRNAEADAAADTDIGAQPVDMTQANATHAPIPGPAMEDMAEVTVPTTSAPGRAHDPEVDLGEAFAAEFEEIAAREAEKAAIHDQQDSTADTFDLEFGEAFADELAAAGTTDINAAHPVGEYAETATHEPLEGSPMPPAPDFNTDSQPVGASRGNKRYLIAALVVASVFGIIAAGYGFWGGGAEPGGGAKIIKAESGPVKVKPEDPGGRVVANQDKASYEKVEGSLGSGQQQQESLISSTEEPADLGGSETAQGLAGLNLDNGLPGVGPKSDDRLSPTAQEENGAELTDIAPRKVRTLTVKPDGTILRQDEPAAIVQTGEATGSLSSEAPQDVLVAAAETSIDGAQSTGNVSIPEASPLPKPEQPLQLRTEPVTETPKVETAATTPETQPAVNAAQRSEWVVQVSSQRSADAAQASYDNLASRFQILQGRPMSIQRADIEDKGTFYRVRIQTASRTDADQLCNSLKNSGGSCFVTR